ncbi:MAG: pyridoxamine 5'-phosphate oxidase family protein [Parvibaculaceae bacterium]|nr:pyridoxamine 5'-phosphate oxidase family protein [Parvibaculaceae bacterium]
MSAEPYEPVPYEPADVYRPRRSPGRESYDRALVHAILDEGMVAHVSYQGGHGPEIIPAFYVRHGEEVLVHLSRRAGLASALQAGTPFAFCVTHLDGLVLARSAFHHSMNYRSVIVHGVPREVTGEEKLRLFDLFIDKAVPGRSKEARPANGQEARATGVFALPLVHVVAKTRSGGPNDDAADMALPVWAGVIPLAMVRGEPIEDRVELAGNI